MTEPIKTFEYEITRHPATAFREVAIFCSQEGACNLETVPVDQVAKLAGILNERGLAGWELIQLAFGHGGMLAFWKREK